MIYNIDLADLVRKSLIACGCHESLLNNFDAHSTIQLEFNEKPSIFISRDEEDEVWIWSTLFHLSTEEERTYLLEKSKSWIEEKLEAECDFSQSKKIELTKSEEGIHLKAKVDHEYLYDHEKFSSALTRFFDNVTEFSEMLK